MGDFIYKFVLLFVITFPIGVIVAMVLYRASVVDGWRQKLFKVKGEK